MQGVNMNSSDEREWSYKPLQVLHAVACGSRYGFDIMDSTGLHSGQVYRALSKLEEAGLVRSEWEDPDEAVQQKRPRRRYYDVTAAGRATLVDVAERFAALAQFPGAPEKAGSGA
jgi:DNA-binding PadR family transcriptional regulator